MVPVLLRAERLVFRVVFSGISKYLNFSSREPKIRRDFLNRQQKKTSPMARYCDRFWATSISHPAPLSPVTQIVTPPDVRAPYT